MAYSIFVSHSFKNHDIVEKMAKSLRQPDAELYVAEADRQYGESLPSKIMKAIDACDAVIVIITKEANGSASMNQEVGYALGKEKLIIPMVEEGTKVGVLLQGLEFVEFSLSRLEEALGKIVTYVAKKASTKRMNTKKEQNVLLFLGIALVAISLIAIIVYAAAKK